MGEKLTATGLHLSGFFWCLQRTNHPLIKQAIGKVPTPNWSTYDSLFCNASNNAPHLFIQDTLVKVDRFAKDLHDSLAARNLTDIVDVVFVSDHGMTDTSHPTQVFINEILGHDGIKDIEHEDGWPSVGLRFHSDANTTKHLNALLEASYENPEKFAVYTHETMPERYHSQIMNVSLLFTLYLKSGMF